MKKERISETIGNIDRRYIDEATEYRGETPQNIRHKLAAIVACFVLVFAVGLPFAKDLFGSRGQKDIVDSVMLIEFDGAYWEIIEDPNALKKFGLEKEITEGVIGSHIAYLQKDAPEAERSNYIASDEETNVELLSYAAAPFKAVGIFRDGDRYSYALFRNYLIAANESLPMQVAFAVYGISGAEDIACITPIKTDNTWAANGETITDSAVISKFYTEIAKLTAYSFDEYHNAIYADELGKYEDKDGGDVRGGLYTRVADDYKEVKITTKDGLNLVIGYYPSYNWIKADETLSYYQMSPEMSNWFSNSIK